MKANTPHTDKDYYLKNELYGLVKKDDKIFDFIQNVCLDGLWFWDLEKPENEWMNPMFWKTLGYNPDEMPHAPSAWQDIINKDDLKLATNNFNKHLSDENHPYDQIVRYRHKDGHIVWIRCKGNAIRDENGKPVRMLGIHTEITSFKNNEFKYKSLIEGTNVGTWEWNVQTGATVYNERWAEIVGYTLEELAPISIETWMKLAHPDDLEESERKLNACFERNSEFYEFEARMKHKNGHWVWVYDRGKVFEWTEDGKPLWMYGTHQDITERKEKEEKLRISEEVFRGNFEHSAIGMALLDENGKWLEVNKRVCEIVGYAKEELLQLTFQDITHPEDLDKDLALLHELVQGKRTHYHMEKRYFHKKGHIVYIILAVSMVKDGEGNVLYFTAQIIDITLLKRTEMHLKTLLAENKAIMNASTKVAFVTTDKDGLIENINVGVKKLLGYSTGQAKDKYIKDLLFLQEEWKEATKALIKNNSKKADTSEILYALANESKFKNREWIFKKADGSTIYVLVSITEINMEYKAKRFLFAATNISQLKSIQAQLRQKNEELEQFAYIAAHDMKEPLRGITTYLSVLQKKYGAALDEKASTYINNAYNNATRMKALITDILDFSKTGEIGNQPIDLNNLLDSIIANYQSDDKVNVVISRSKMPTLKGDTSSFVQLFTNLIENGIKYQPQGQIPKIKIKATEKEKNWLFSVADNGIGIHPKHHDKVFEIFKRLHANSNFSGTGIGLATCKKIVTAYGGEIWFEPIEPNGTTFKFTIQK